MNEKLYEVAKPEIFFKCEFGVFKKGSDSSVCYTTSEQRGRFVAAALDAFEKSGAANEWLTKEAKKP